MFYPNYEDYMRDIFYFNGLQNSNENMGYPYMGFGQQNLNDYFPHIYKIINPVVQKVVSGNNYQFANEDSVNNIVEVVLGITAGDITALENSSNNGDKRQTQNNNSMGNQQPQEFLPILKDLVKILTIKELQSKQNVRRFPYTYGNMPYYMPTPSPYMAN